MKQRNTNSGAGIASLTRREFVKAAGASVTMASGGLRASTTTKSDSEGHGSRPPTRPNILFILTDQERYIGPSELPAGYVLPGRERLRREGVTFTNHQIASAVCTSSRSVIYTGQHMQNTGMFDNMGFPWSNALPKGITTVGHMLQGVGYHAGYLGKWHLSDELEDIEMGNVPEPDIGLLNEVMRGHGFEDYIGVGDIVGKTLGGYRTDEFTTSTAVRWLRAEAAKLRVEETPWFLAVNLVNPHDVMFIDTDGPEESQQKSTGPLFPINHPPRHELYQRRWNAPLPKSRNEPADGPGHPTAHREYLGCQQTLLGRIPNQDARWTRLMDYYLNCIADCDRHVERLLEELDALGLADDTIVIMTSDHGELAGAHGMTGKGATAYQEQNQVPLWIRHPDHRDQGGKECRAVTSHLDLAPTFLGLAGADEEQRATLAPKAKGSDLSSLLKSPEAAGADAVRHGALYNYNMWLYQDAEFLAKVVAALRAGKDVAKEGLKPDLTKRCAIRSVSDGRYRFSRYFSPLQHNLPRSFEEIMKHNDVELFDLEEDPDEVRNLAVDPEAHGELLLAMNAKMSKLIEDEVGRDEGQFLPENKAGWNVTTVDP